MPRTRRGRNEADRSTPVVTETHWRLVTDVLPVLIAYCDRDAIYRFCNARHEEWFDLKPADLLGRPMAEVLGKEAFGEIEPYLPRVLGGERVSAQHRLPCRHGPPRDVKADYVPDVADTGEVIGYCAVMEDVSQRVVTNEHSRSRLAAIVKHSNDAIIAKTLDGKVTEWNAAAEKMYGYTAEEMTGRSVAILAPDDRKPEIDQILDRVKRGEAVEHFETVRQRKDGSRLYVSLTVSPILDREGQVVGASIIARDITERKQTEREREEWADLLEERVAERTRVAEKRARDLRDLASQVTDAEQRARKRLAQEIHDDLQQILVATKMRLPTDDEIPSGEDLRKISDLLDEALKKSRALVSEMSPPLLHDGPLADAFDWLAQHMEDHHSLEVDVRCEGRLENIDEKTRSLVFEIVRELLFNVVKHAETDEATVVVTGNAESLVVRVKDSGKGFDPRVVEDRSKGFGLLSVRERLEAFGGNLEMTAAPGKGSRFLITVPVGREKKRAAEPGP